MVTRAPAEQNPAVDPELPQPPTTTPGPPVTDPAPLPPVVPADVNPFGPVVNVIVNPDLVPLVPTDVNPFPPVVNVVVEPEPVPAVRGPEQYHNHSQPHHYTRHGLPW